MATTAERVPVTILTGSLGAGKTTLLRRILTEKHGLRIAVIENELADSMGIESLILKQEVGGKVADGFFELSNGCLCCTQRDGLVDTLQRLMRLRDRFDRILVETSGAADPGPVASTFWTDLGEEDALLTLDGIVTVVDAVNFENDLRRPREAGAMNETARQVAFADLILINKIDLLHSSVVDPAATSAESRVAQLQERLRAINAAATIVPCVRGEIPLEQLLGLHAYQTAHVAVGHDATAGSAGWALAGAAAAPSHALGPLHGIENAVAAAAPTVAAAHAGAGGPSPHADAADAADAGAEAGAAEGARKHHHHDAACGAACASHVHDSRIGSWVWQQSTSEPLKLRPGSSSSEARGGAGSAAPSVTPATGSGSHSSSPGQRILLDYDAFRQWLGVLVWEGRIPTPENVGAGAGAAGAAGAAGTLKSAAAAELSALGPPPPVTVRRTKGAVWLAADTAPADEVAACSLRTSGGDGGSGAEGKAAGTAGEPVSGSAAASGPDAAAATASASSAASACFLLQGVHDLFEVTPLRTGGLELAALPPIASAGAVVFIGDGVAQAAPWLQASLLACAASH